MSERIVATDDHEGYWYTGEEIVRCRDCKYMSRDTYVFKWCYRLSPEFACEPDGFCAWGEQKEDA